MKIKQKINAIGVFDNFTRNNVVTAISYSLEKCSK